MLADGSARFVDLVEIGRVDVVIPHSRIVNWCTEHRAEGIEHFRRQPARTDQADTGSAQNAINLSKPARWPAGRRLR